MFFINCMKDIKCGQHTILSLYYAIYPSYIEKKKPLPFCFQDARLIEVFISKLPVQFFAYS